MLKKEIILLITVIATLAPSGCNINRDKQFEISKVVSIKEPAIAFEAETYVCYKGDSLDIDGVIDEKSWQLAAWTSDFVDIEGELKDPPLYRTRAKMLWDNDYLYIAAELSEPHIQARLRQRDTVIFYDNDFEVFIDPDGDTHGYYELEINAFNTAWDLLLTRPYRDKGNRVIDAWNISGLKSAVKIYGTINDPSDTDNRWTLEIAIPFDVLSEWGNHAKEGRQWRINFSRVNWRWEPLNGSYRKALDPSTGKNFPEYNWVWSPQGVINMHYPEMWGYLQFSETKVGDEEIEFKENPDEELKWKLRKLYYSQRKYAAEKGVYASFVRDLNRNFNINLDKAITILHKPGGYEAYIKSESSGLTWIIRDDGRIFPLAE